MQYELRLDGTLICDGICDICPIIETEPEDGYVTWVAGARKTCGLFEICIAKQYDGKLDPIKDVAYFSRNPKEKHRSFEKFYDPKTG